MGEMFLNISNYMCEMELNKVLRKKMIESFEFVMISKIHRWVRELKENDGGSCMAFMQTLIEKFLMEDS